MYQFEIGPKFGPGPTAQHKTTRINRNPSGSSVTLLDSSNRKRTLYYKLLLALVTGCFFAFLSGCGGTTLNSSSLAKSTTSASTTGALSSISCGTQSLTGAQSKGCSVYLSAPATNATSVSLTSSNSALNVPASVVVPAGAKSGGFSVVARAVSTSVSVTITGKAGSGAKTDVITLYPAPASATAPALSKISCGAQTISGATTKACSVYLTAAATSQTVVTLSSNNSALQVPASVTVPAGSASGGFGATAVAVSTTQTATLTATADGVTETDAIQLEGTGASGSSQHKVQLSWNAPTGTSDTIVGYMVYRATSGGSSYALLTSSVDTQTTFADTTVQSGLTYDYMVKSVDSKGIESAPSNSTAVTVP